jgi:tetratricopeptide (TPR) repeat protein
MKDEQSLDDLQKVAQSLLAEVQKFQDEDSRYLQFTRLRGEALIHATLFTGMDVASNLEKTRQACRAGLGLFGMATDPSTHSRGLELADPARKAELTNGCYELLLILADTFTHAPSGGGKASSRDTEQALGILDQAATLGLDTRAWHQRRARYLELLSRSAAAEQERARAAALAPSTAEDYFLMGDERYKEGDFERGVRDFDGVLHLQPHHFWARYFQAIGQLQLGRPREAAINMTACLDQRGDLVWVYLIHALAEGQLKDFAAAEDDYSSALKCQRDPNAEYVLYVNRGFLRYLEGREADAVADLTHAIQLRPDQYSAYANLSQVYQRQKRWNEAKRNLDEAIRLQPALASLYRTRAHLAEQSGDLPAALEDFRRVIQVAPRSIRPHDLAQDHVAVGRLLHRLQRYEEALEPYDAALVLDPAYVQIYRWQAAAQFELGRYEQAAASLDHYLARKEILRPEFLAVLGATPFASSSVFLSAALTVSSPIYGAAPTGLAADVYWARGRARAKAHNYAGAVSDYTRALETTPDPLLYLDRGWAYISVGTPRLALTDFEQAVLFDPKNAEAYTARGHARAQLGQYRPAVRDAETACSLAPKNPRVVYGAARILAQAVDAVETDRRRPGQWTLASEFRDQAVLRLRQALALLPATDRRAFWRDRIQADSALSPIRQSTGFLHLAEEYSGIDR